MAGLGKLLFETLASHGLICKSSDEWTDGEDSLDGRVSVHLLGCQDTISPRYEGSSTVNFPEFIITEDKIEWTIHDSFQLCCKIRQILAVAKDDFVGR